MGNFIENRYIGHASLEQMRQLCITLRKAGIGASHTGDLNWGTHMHIQLNPHRDVRLWTATDSGELMAFAQHDKKYGVTIEMALTQRQNLELLNTIVRWALTHAAQFQEDSAVPSTVKTSAWDSNEQFGTLLQAATFTVVANDLLYSLRRSLDQEIPAPQLPPGSQVRHVDGNTEIDARAAIHAEVWHPSKVTPDGYRIARSAPNYAPTFDLVAVSETGEFGAYCVAWPEYETSTIEFEPVGTRAAFRRKRLGQAVLFEGMRRAKALGLQTAIVHCEDHNLDFYQSVGFEIADRCQTYTLETPHE